MRPQNIDIRDLGVAEGGDISIPLQSWLNNLPAKGGTLFGPNSVWYITKPIIFPVGKQFTGAITNISIRGESSGLACSGGYPMGLRFNYSGTGKMFDLSNALCFNVQFRDFEVVDTNGSQETVGIHASNFKTGCIIENVGFRDFWKSVVLDGESYYSKLDRIVSLSARDTGLEIHNPNMNNIFRCLASYGQGTGLRVFGSLGTLITAGHYENNSGYGIEVVGDRHVVIQNNYFEQNELGNIHVIGTRLSEIDIHGNIEI